MIHTFDKLEELAINDCMGYKQQILHSKATRFDLTMKLQAM